VPPTGFGALHADIVTDFWVRCARVLALVVCLYVYYLRGIFDHVVLYVLMPLRSCCVGAGKHGVPVHCVNHLAAVDAC
jgi:hypothetical protein